MLTFLALWVFAGFSAKRGAVEIADGRAVRGPAGGRDARLHAGGFWRGNSGFREAR